MNTNRLLLDEHPLQVMPTLAKVIGLNEAIVLQQVHYWLQDKKKNNKDYYNGHYWIYNTYEKWNEQFPFWSVATIRRTIAKLEKKDELLIVGNYNMAGFDKTKWYTINYDTLDKLMSAQNEHIVCSNCNNGSAQNEQTNTIDYTETTYIDIKESVREKKTKHKYGEYKNVLLTDDEYKKLAEEYSDISERIERLSEYIASKGVSYKSHYATIRAWARKDNRTSIKKNKDPFMEGLQRIYEEALANGE